MLFLKRDISDRFFPDIIDTESYGCISAITRDFIHTCIDKT